jgi:hypothetical protein
LGYEDETWWSRIAQPDLHAWTDPDQPMHLVEQTFRKDDPECKALACYGLLLRWQTQAGQSRETMWLRFVDGRPVSDITIQFLNKSCQKLHRMGQEALLLVWDNASWHISQAVRQWIHDHNRQVKQRGRGVRIVVCPLPTKSPWLNPIEPKWVHGKRRVVEPDRILPAVELADRVCATFGCAHEPHLVVSEKVV